MNTIKENLIKNESINNKGLTFRTIGTTLQALSVQLDENEAILSESGKMAWMTDNIKMTTHGQSISQIFSRLFTRESIFVNKFTCLSGTGVVTFTTGQLGKVIPIELGEDKPSVIFQKGAYLCSETGIKRSIAFMKRLGVGLFGGKGFILQKVEGKGNAFLVSDGESLIFELKDGQEILADQGNLVAYESTVDFDIRTIGGGPFNWLFGGEGIFVSRLRGPGKVWLQTKKPSFYNNYRASNINNYRRNPIGAIISILFSVGIFFCFIIMMILDGLNK